MGIPPFEEKVQGLLPQYLGTEKMVKDDCLGKHLRNKNYSAAFSGLPAIRNIPYYIMVYIIHNIPYNIIKTYKNIYYNNLSYNMIKIKYHIITVKFPSFRVSQHCRKDALTGFIYAL